MENDNRPLLLSLKPRFADLVFSGLKTAELRRRIARCAVNRDVFVYVSSPVRELRGGFRVEHVWEGSPESVWEQVSDLARVGKGDFDAYYGKRRIAYALKITDVWLCQTPASLENLRTELEDFVVPQSWRYVKSEEHCWLGEMSRLGRNLPDKTSSIAGARSAGYRRCRK